MTASTILDFNMVATADKFGNVSVVSHTSSLLKVGVVLCLFTPLQIRLPQGTSDEDPTGTRTIWGCGWLSGAA